jgi:hypothetical protein
MAGKKKQAADPLAELIRSVTLADGAALDSLVDSSPIERRHLDLAREAELRLRRLRLEIKAHLANAKDGRCHCGEVLKGRSDQVYCSATCREAARRQRDRQPSPAD